MMDEQKSTDTEPAMRCEPVQAGLEEEGQDVEPAPADDDRTLEEAGYGYGV